MNVDEFFKKHPNKSLNDYYAYLRNNSSNSYAKGKNNGQKNENSYSKNEANIDQISNSVKKKEFNFAPYLIGILIGFIIVLIKFPQIINIITDDTRENIELTNYNTGEKFEVANEDLEMKMSQEEAESECNKLGNGWRLPTISELEIIYDDLHKKGLGGFKDETYWSGDSYEFDFANGSSPYNPNILPQDLVKIPKWVRLVRSKSSEPNNVGNGVIIQDNEKREIFCPNCNGTGKEKYDCSTCKGDGVYEEYRLSEGGKVPFECYSCKGFGYHETSCGVCGGGGKVYQ